MGSKNNPDNRGAEQKQKKIVLVIDNGKKKFMEEVDGKLIDRK